MFTRDDLIVIVRELPFFIKHSIHFILEKRQARFFCCLQILFDQFVDCFSIIKTQSHGLIIRQATSHVPTEFYCLTFDLMTFFVHAFDQLINFLRGRDQEAVPKKLAMSRVNGCVYWCLHSGQARSIGLISLACLRAIT